MMSSSAAGCFFPKTAKKNKIKSKMKGVNDATLIFSSNLSWIDGVPSARERYG
jgi:hypothetical protein